MCLKFDYKSRFLNLGVEIDDSKKFANNFPQILFYKELLDSAENLNYVGVPRYYAQLSVEATYRGWGQVQNYIGNAWGLI